MGKRRRVSRQAGIRKASESEPSAKHRIQETTSKPRSVYIFGMNLAATRLLARWCPVLRRREPDLQLLQGTWEGACRDGCRWPGKGRWWREGARRAAETVRRWVPMRPRWR